MILGGEITKGVVRNMHHAQETWEMAIKF